MAKPTTQCHETGIISLLMCGLSIILGKEGFWWVGRLNFNDLVSKDDLKMDIIRTWYLCLTLVLTNTIGNRQKNALDRI